MSTRVDIIAAKNVYNEHNGLHKCRAGQCRKRATLWLAYMKTAELWYAEPGDDERQREQSKMVT